MTEHNGNVEALKRAYFQWVDSRGQAADGFLAIVSDDFEIKSVADHYAEAKFGGAPTGKEGMKRYLLDIGANWIMEHYDIEKYIASGDQVAVVANIAFRHRQTGKEAGGALVDVWTFKDGLAASVLEVFDTASMIAAATPD